MFDKVFSRIVDHGFESSYFCENDSSIPGPEFYNEMSDMVKNETLVGYKFCSYDTRRVFGASAG